MTQILWDEDLKKIRRQIIEIEIIKLSEEIRVLKSLNIDFHYFHMRTEVLASQILVLEDELEKL